MLVVLVALIHLLNQAFALLPAVDGEPLTLQRLSGYCLAPIAWLVGIPWSEAKMAGALLGTKPILNELIAYQELSNLADGTLSERSELILTYALCGFSNLGSLGIMIGGLGTLVPERRQEIVKLGSRSIIAGLLATLLTGSVVGMLH